jgi:hypothetical protein
MKDQDILNWFHENVWMKNEPASKDIEKMWKIVEERGFEIRHSEQTFVLKLSGSLGLEILTYDNKLVYRLVKVK